MADNKTIIAREILLAFWKVHILHHAAEAPVYGAWIVSELRRHGYDISPGTLYPLLKRMEAHGWLKCNAENKHPKARRLYTLTKEGARVLKQIRAQVQELYDEVIENK